MPDPFELDRFVAAQRSTYPEVVAELRTGRKMGHWMWFVFPQLEGLGTSWMAQRYAISSLAEAEAYLRHPVLGPRLIECTHLILAVKRKSAQEIFGGIDALKLRSSMTLFARAAPDEPVFQQVLTTYFDGLPDEKTLARL